MKLNKKFLSCFMAATMAATPFTAFAAEGDVASNQIEGSGSVEYLNTEIYNVILPTSDAINFHVDPYGLLQIGNDGQALDKVISSEAGGVTSKATAVINKSSVPINVSVEVNVYNAKGTTAAAIALTDNAAGVGEVSDDEHAGLFLKVVEYSGAVSPEAAFVTGSAGTTVTFDDALEATEAALLLSTASLEIYNPTVSTATAIKANGANTDVSGSSINFKLDGMPSAYNVLSTGAVKINEASAAALICTDSATALKANVVKVLTIEGAADRESKVWKKFTGDAATQELKISMKFVITSGNAKAETIPTYGDGDTLTYTGGDSITFKSAFDTVTEVFINDGNSYPLDQATIDGNTITLSKNDDANTKYFLETPGTYVLYVYSGSDYHTLTFTIK